MQRPTRARADWENQTRFLAIDLLACARCAATCPRRVGEVVGWYLVTKDSYDRYRKPVMHTETNLDEHQDSVAWL